MPPIIEPSPDCFLEPSPDCFSTKTTPNQYGVYKAEVVNKTANGGISTFFPLSMSPEEICNEMELAYQNRILVPGKNYEYTGVFSNGITVHFFLDKFGIITSFYPEY